MKAWFTPNKITVIFTILLLVSISSGFRYYQLYEWENKHPSYFVKDTVSLTTLDGYYWIRLAKSYDNITDKNAPDIYRGYPDHPYSYGMEMHNLLVFLINKVAKFVGNYYYAGIYLVIVLSSLFIIPLFLYLHRIGSLSTALMSTILTTFGYSYLFRTFVGRVDTDCMNLFFPFMMTYLIYIIPKFNGIKKYLLSIMLGLTSYLFMWWYYYPGFLIAYLGILIVYLVIKRERFLELLFVTILFVIFTNPKYFLYGFDNIKYFIFGSKYFAGESLKVNQVAWPNIAEFISETQKQSWDTILLYAAGHKYIGILGFVGLILLISKAKFDIIPSFPILMLGFISFKSGNRFTMYLSPFLYAGLGYLIYFLSEYISKNILKLFKDYVKIFSEILSGTISIIFIVVILNLFSGIHYKVTPSVPLDIQQTMLDLKNRFGKLPVVWTWWDYGYAYQDLAGFSTVHDGGIQGKERTYFIGLGLTLPDQNKLRNIISYFDYNGFHSLERGNLDIKKLISDAINFDKPVKKSNILLAVSYDMVYKYDGIDFFGKWDFDKKTSNYSDYEKISCYYSNDYLKCNDEQVDLRVGIWGDEQISKIFIFNGEDNVKVYDFKTEGRIIQVVLKNGNVFISYILDNEVFNSNFNQLYFFGKYDDKIFEKVYDNFPIMRIYRVK